MRTYTDIQLSFTHVNAYLTYQFWTPEWVLPVSADMRHFPLLPTELFLIGS